jgi:acyl-coenzyme A thioesterase PaaI-like protein
MTQSATARASTTLAMYQKLAGLPLGKKIFSAAVCLKAPYFSSIRPRFVDLRPGRSVVTMRKRRAVQNHLGTVHALAAGNLCELAAGTVMEASLPAGMRWIPKGMDIQYLAKAETDITAHAEAPTDYPPDSREVPITVQVTDTAGREVVRAVIRMWVSPKR